MTLVCSLFRAVKDRQGLDVSGLRKHIERLDVADPITARDQIREIARQGRRVARQIPNPRNARAHERREGRLITPLARRIKEDDVGRGERLGAALRPPAKNVVRSATKFRSALAFASRTAFGFSSIPTTRIPCFAKNNANVPAPQ